MQVGISETTVFKMYHPDAESLFNVSMNMEKVITELSDHNYRPPKKVSCFLPLLAAITFSPMPRKYTTLLLHAYLC